VESHPEPEEPLINSPRNVNELASLPLVYYGASINSEGVGSGREAEAGGTAA
jgi:hypothetical protein